MVGATRGRHWLIPALLCGVAAGCAPMPPQPTAVPPRPAETAGASAEARAAEAERERYIAHALAGDRIPGLRGLHQVGSATGFYIATDKILTNYHAVVSCKASTVGNDVEGTERLAKLIASDPAKDLAVLVTDATVTQPARFETALYTETGDDLAIVGYPEHGLTVLEAELSPVVAAAQDLAGDAGRYRFRGAVRRGNSGSPVLDDTAAVLGIVEAKIDTIAVYQRTGNVVDDIGFAISNRVVLDFLHANGIAYLRAQAAPSLTPAQLLARAHGFVRQIGCWR